MQALHNYKAGVTQAGSSLVPSKPIKLCVDVDAIQFINF